jgi:hypothetical protein
MGLLEKLAYTLFGYTMAVIVIMAVLSFVGVISVAGEIAVTVVLCIGGCIAWSVVFAFLITRVPLERW